MGKERLYIMSEKVKGKKLHIDLDEVSAVPEIRIEKDRPQSGQHDVEKEGDICVIKEGVAVPEVLKEKK